MVSTTLAVVEDADKKRKREERFGTVEDEVSARRRHIASFVTRVFSQVKPKAKVARTGGLIESRLNASLDDKVFKQQRGTGVAQIFNVPNF